jgi:spoIIIJ-associated protein
LTERKYSVSTIALRIDGFLRDVLENGGLKLTYDIQDAKTSDADFETPDVMVKFSGSDVDLLLSNRAELLLALEHVTMEMLRMPSEDHSRISFDANDYRLLRIEELRLSATVAGEKVKRTGELFRFNPMNSRERRVIHLSLRNETTLRSESAGAGPGRHVVVYPAGMASLPAPPYVPEPFRSPDRERPDRDRRGSGGPPRRSGGPRRDGGGPPRGPRR